MSKDCHSKRNAELKYKYVRNRRMLASTTTHRGNMDTQDKRRFVQQYVERQKAYLPTYTTEHLLNERQGTPAKSLRSDEFGFDTPVLRSRVPENNTARSQLTLKAGRNALVERTHEAEPATVIPPKQGAPPIPGEAPSETQDPGLGKKDKARSKRKKAPTPMDTDNERAASRSLSRVFREPFG